MTLYCSESAKPQSCIFTSRQLYSMKVYMSDFREQYTLLVIQAITYQGSVFVLSHFIQNSPTRASVVPKLKDLGVFVGQILFCIPRRCPETLEATITETKQRIPIIIFYFPIAQIIIHVTQVSYTIKGECRRDTIEDTVLSG